MGGAGLTESFEDGDVTVSVGAGAGITVAADTVAVTGAAALTDGYLPNWDNATGGFENSPLRTDGQNLHVTEAMQPWIGNFRAFQLNVTAAFWAEISADTQTGLTLNARYDLTDNRWEYITPNPALQMYLVGATGIGYLQYAAAGVADAAITWGTALSWNLGGNIGIGTATFQAASVNNITIVNGTEPGAATANQIYIGSKDSSAGAANATLMLYTEQAVEAGAPTPANKLRVWINGTEWWIGLDPV
jgi:hypothetical protein